MAYPGGFAEYMRIKRQKLAQQALVTSSNTDFPVTNPILLKGLVLHVNGYIGDVRIDSNCVRSSLSMIEFREWVVAHGAEYREIFSSKVTHIIASQMTSSKIMQLKQPVVKPQWITDSIQSGVLQDWKKYRLYTTHSPSQKRIISAGMSEKHAQPEVQRDEKSANTVLDEDEAEDDAEHTFDPDEETNVTEENTSYPPEIAAFIKKRDGVNIDLKNEWIQSLISTAPGFIQNFFAQSRLHHLSTWKAELSQFVREKMDLKWQRHSSFSQNQSPSRGSMITSKNRSSSVRQSDSVLKSPLRTIMHVDMDCFFASVAIRDRPHLQNQPVAVTHSTGSHSSASKNETSSAEIASCNYKARSFGIKNGMFLGRAKEMAPGLALVPYEFDKYDAASKALYHVLVKYADFVEAVSCDEAFIDVTETLGQKIGYLSEVDPAILSLQAQDLAEAIRTEILKVTGCTASIGIGHNILLARLATRKAKPNGVHYVARSQSDDFLRTVSISDLPRVGWVISQKCDELGLKTCRDLSCKRLSELQRLFGTKTGQMLYSYAQGGQDNRVLQNKERKSIGAEINWGIRFETHEQIQTFFQDFAKEVYQRMDKWNVVARHITVTAKKKLYQGEPPKFLGCGKCQDYSKSQNLPRTITNAQDLFRHAWSIYCDLKLVPTDVRGLGIHLKKLSPAAGNPIASLTEVDEKQKLLTFARIDHNPFLADAHVSAESLASQFVDSNVEGSPSTPSKRKKPRVPTDFFTPRKRKRAQAFEDKYGIDPSQVDSCVFEELPPDIQQELKAAGLDPSSQQLPSWTSPSPPSIRTATIPKLMPPQNKSFAPADWIPSASQMDLSVLDALPDYLRNEQLQVILERNARVKDSSVEFVEKDDNPFLVTPHEELNDIQVINPEDDEQEQVLYLKDLNDSEDMIKDVIVNWIQKERHSAPCPIALREIKICLTNAVESLRSDFAVRILKIMFSTLGITLGSNSKGKNREDWTSALQTLFDVVDHAVQKVHGRPLFRWFESS